MPESITDRVNRFLGRPARKPTATEITAQRALAAGRTEPGPSTRVAPESAGSVTGRCPECGQRPRVEAWRRADTAVARSVARHNI